MKSYYYKHDGQELGPVSAAQLKRLTADGLLLREDWIRADGSEEWVRASRYQELFPQPATGDARPSPPPNVPQQGAKAAPLSAQGAPVPPTTPSETRNPTSPSEAGATADVSSSQSQTPAANDPPKSAWQQIKDSVTEGYRKGYRTATVSSPVTGGDAHATGEPSVASLPVKDNSARDTAIGCLAVLVVLVVAVALWKGGGKGKQQAENAESTGGGLEVKGYDDPHPEVRKAIADKAEVWWLQGYYTDNKRRVDNDLYVVCQDGAFREAWVYRCTADQMNATRLIGSGIPWEKKKFLEERGGHIFWATCLWEPLSTNKDWKVKTKDSGTPPDRDVMRTESRTYGIRDGAQIVLGNEGSVTLDLEYPDEHGRKASKHSKSNWSLITIIDTEKSKWTRVDNDNEKGTFHYSGTATRLSP